MGSRCRGIGPVHANARSPIIEAREPKEKTNIRSSAGNEFFVVGGILYGGVFASAVAYVAWNRGDALFGPSCAAPFMYLMLVYTPLLSIAFLGESVHGYHLAGGALIVAGIHVATLFAARPPR